MMERGVDEGNDDDSLDPASRDQHLFKVIQCWFHQLLHDVDLIIR